MTTATTDPEAPVDTVGAPAAPRRFGPATLAAAAVAALLVGFASAMVVLRPPAAPGEGSPEVGFARDMIVHHAQAVEMSMIAWADAAHPSVRQLGYDIATLQQGQIGTMHQWLHEWGASPTHPDPNDAMAWMPDGAAMAGYPMPGMASPEQMAELRDAEGLEVDRLFLELMLTHHLGGIHMVDGVLALSDHEDVTGLAGIMKDGQQRELTVLQDLLREVEQRAAVD